MAKQRDPETGGGQDPADNKGGAPDAGAEIVARVLAEFEPRMNSAVTGAVKRHIDAALSGDAFAAKFGDLMGKVLAESEKKRQPPPPPPADDVGRLKLEVEGLKAATQAQEALLQREAAMRTQAEEAGRRERLIGGIRDAIAGLDGKEGRPKVRGDIQGELLTLIGSGHRLISPPKLADDGSVVVEGSDGMRKLLRDVLANGYFGSDHWALDKFSAAGSGARGASGAKPEDKTVDWEKAGSAQGTRDLADKYKGDSAGLAKALEDRQQTLLTRKR